MATHIVLINYTDQGMRNVKQIPKQRKDAFAAAEKLGITVKEAYMTMGGFDVVLVADSPSDEAMAAWSLSVGLRATSAPNACGPSRPMRWIKSLPV